MVSPDTLPPKSSSFDPPEEPVWHRMIAETAYYLAERRGFAGEHSLDDWLAAEQQVRKTLSPNLGTEAKMNATGQERADKATDVVAAANKPPSDAQTTPQQPMDVRKQQSPSRYEKFAATQAAGDGIQGDPLKKGQTAAEKLGANMADRK